MANKMTPLLLLLGANKQYGNPPIGRTMLVKQIYLVEQLRPVYNIWFNAFEFVRFKHGPYSEDIFHNLDQLIFAGLVAVPEFKISGRKVEAVYDITDQGQEYVQNLLVDHSNTKINGLCKDLIWSLQTFGVKTAQQIIDIVYQEPEFLRVTDESNRRGLTKEDKVPLSESVNPNHPSFRVQSILAHVGATKLGPDYPPRELIRTYLLSLAVEHYKSKQGSSAHR